MPTDHESDGGEGQTSTDEPSVKMCTWRPDEEETSIFPTDSGHVTVTAPTPYLPASGEEQVVMAAAKVSTAVHVSGTFLLKELCLQQKQQTYYNAFFN